MSLENLDPYKKSKITAVFRGFLWAACGESTIENPGSEDTNEVTQTDDNPQDAEANQGDEDTSETNTLGQSSLPTWAAYRQMFLDETLEHSPQVDCDDLYLSAPLDRLYGIHFIMISHPSNEEQWLDERLSYMKSLFEPERIQFATKYIEDFSDCATVSPNFWASK